MFITNKTKFNMVIGYPLAHTQSPTLHNTLYQRVKMDAIFIPFPLKNLEDFIKMLPLLPVGLFAVTMPFKEKILSFLDECSDEVRDLKAANTVICQEGKLVGYNTDVDGIAYALKKITLYQKNVLLLGAGGAARAAAYFLKKNAANIFWHHRSLEKALQMQAEFGGEVVKEINQIENKINVVINATPVGMYPETHLQPLPHFCFSEDMIVFDMIYHPYDTSLLRDARNQGAKTIAGIDMFVAQGIRQVELWTQQKLFNETLTNEIKKSLRRAYQ